MKTALKTEGNFLKYFANGVFRCHLDSGVSQLLLYCNAVDPTFIVGEVLPGGFG